MANVSRKPYRSTERLTWVRTLPCVIGNRDCFGRVEAAHTGPHGFAQKSSDKRAIPLCVAHHRTRKDSYHELGPRRFEDCHGVNINEIVAKLQQRPVVKVIGGKFVAWIWGEEFVLRPVQDGPRLMMQCLMARIKDMEVTW